MQACLKLDFFAGKWLDVMARSVKAPNTRLIVAPHGVAVIAAFALGSGDAFEDEHFRDAPKMACEAATAC